MPDPPAELRGSPRPVMGAAAWSSPLFSPEPLWVAWPHSQEGASVPAHHLAGGLCWGCHPCPPWGWRLRFLPLGSPPASSTPHVPLTHLAPDGSDSAAPPGKRFPTAVPAKEGVRDTWFSILPTPTLRSSSKVNSTPLTSFLKTHTAKGHGEESSDKLRRLRRDRAAGTQK